VGVESEMLVCENGKLETQRVWNLKWPCMKMEVAKVGETWKVVIQLGVNSEVATHKNGKWWWKWVMADHGGFKFITYVLTILWHIYSSLINMRCLHILLHI